MKTTKTIHVKAHDTTKTTIVCDTCASEFVDRQWGKINHCRICKDDVCQKCAIVTDHWYLKDGEFSGDYPDYYCPKCWVLGEDIRKQIQEARDKEIQLWEQWHQLRA